MKIKTEVSVKFIGIIMLIALNGCGGEELQSERKDSPITVDGKCDDWLNLTTHYFDKEGMQIVLGIANDDISLNLMMKFRDQRLARMIDRRGVTFWFNGKNQKSKNYGIYYQNPRTDMMAIPRGEIPERGNGSHPEGGGTFQPKGVFSLITQDTVEITGTDISGSEAQVDVREGVFCYEISILIDKIENLPRTLFVSDKNLIKLGFEIAAMSEEDQVQMKEMLAERVDQSRPRGGRGGSGMRGGGGGTKGGRPGGMPDRDGKEIWFTVSLARS